MGDFIICVENPEELTHTTKRRRDGKEEGGEKSGERRKRSRVGRSRRERKKETGGQLAGQLRCSYVEKLENTKVIHTSHPHTKEI